jgi:hypothetical protein
MIVAIGVDVDDTLQHFVRQGGGLDPPLTVVNLRAAVHGQWRFEVPARSPARLEFGGRVIELHPRDAFFCRLIDLSTHEPEAARVARWQALGGALRAWLDSVPGRVVNRCERGAHNMSKPLHEALLCDLGFRVPDSITSCDVEQLREFLSRERVAISKTVCGVRADTVTVTASDFDDFEPEQGPVHLQRRIDGADVRIHVVGEQLIAQRIHTDAVDYRRDGSIDRMDIFDPPAPMRDALIEATARFDLAFAGWDFRIDPDGTYWCLEVNPMPGYQPYDLRCGGIISRQLFAYLGAAGGL